MTVAKTGRLTEISDSHMERARYALSRAAWARWGARQDCR
jgi:hypothetical protein